MKSLTAISIMILFFAIVPLSAQYSSVTIQTPRGVSVDADEFTGTDFGSTEITYWNDEWTNGYNCRIIGNSTNYYNCHGYAWYDIEGRMAQDDLLWINDVNASGNPIYNVTKYYSGTDPSYTQTYTVTNHLKVSYFPRDHSAVTTEDQDSVISKWAYGPLVKHTLSQCPFYTNAQIKYYKLDLDISGSEALLCSGSQRTFTSNSSIPGSTYSWIKDSNLSYVSGANTTTYTVQGSGSDSTYIYLTMTTPSGEVATSSTKEFWVGTPLIEDREVDGNDYYSGYPVCPGDHYLGVTPVGDGAGTATWTVPSGITYWVGTNTLDFTFPSSSYGLYFSARSANSCGTGSSYSFYIAKKTYGCTKSLSIILYPNPASDYVTVSIVDQAEESIEGDTNVGEINNYTVKIYNNQSYLVSTLKRSGKSFEIPIQDLKKGIYIVEVGDGINSCSEQLIVNNK